MPSQVARLLVEVAIGSGLRWGELIQLRPRDLHWASGIVTVTRAVAEVNPKYHPDGGRFLVKPYPKSRHSRRFKLDAQVLAELREHIATHNIGDNDLIFDFRHFLTPVVPKVRLVDAATLGTTEPNADGFTYQHGSLSAYTAGKCRCQHCRMSFATYRARRRADGLDSPRESRARDSDGHLPRDWFQQDVVAAESRSVGDRTGSHARPSARARIVVARRRGRPASRQGTSRSRKHRDHREVPAHVADRRRNSARGLAAHPRAKRPAGVRCPTALSQLYTSARGPIRQCDAAPLAPPPKRRHGHREGPRRPGRLEATPHELEVFLATGRELGDDQVVRV